MTLNIEEIFLEVYAKIKSKISKQDSILMFQEEYVPMMIKAGAVYNVFIILSFWAKLFEKIEYICFNQLLYAAVQWF